MKKKQCCIMCKVLFLIFCIQFSFNGLKFDSDFKTFGMKLSLINKNNSILVSDDSNSINQTVTTNTILSKKNKDIKIIPGGQPVGVKLNIRGVLVVGVSEIKNEIGVNSSPALLAGINIGDTIVKVNNEKIINAKDLASKISESNGEKIEIRILRKNKEFTKKIQPIKNESDGTCKIGLWVRDSTSGVGTLTFYDNKSKVFAALGHPITDIDTGTILNVGEGNIYTSSIIDCKKGEKGDPGELRGIFIEDEVLGTVEKNTNCGIYGEYNKNLKKSNVKPLKVGYKDEIIEGPAKILTTIDGCEPKYYDIEIQKLLNQDEAGSKSMLIKITDEELLKKTGGIVQGMSGSPIIQNDKIIGAVTHVLINKPDVGYGIYIEWMLKEAGIQ